MNYFMYVIEFMSKSAYFSLQISSIMSFRRGLTVQEIADQLEEQQIYDNEDEQSDVDDQDSEHELMSSDDGDVDDHVDDHAEDHAHAAHLVHVQQSMSASAMSFIRASTSLGGSESAYYATDPATSSTLTPPELAGPSVSPTPRASTYHTLENVSRPVEQAQTTSAQQTPR